MDVIAQTPSPRSRYAVLAFLAGSLLLHASILTLASRRSIPSLPPPPPPGELVEVQIAPPPPPPPAPEEVKPPPEKLRPPPIHVAAAPKPVPSHSDLPPPPNEEAKTPPAKNPPPLVVGVTLSSTTTAGSFAAPVGNTAYGKPEGQAQSPDQVKSYSADHYAPIEEVDQQPELVSEFKPTYPEEARRAGVEGRVTLQIVVDEHGNVTTAKVIHGLGYGLDEAAREGMLHAHFKPATRSGSSVATMLTFVYRFELP
jgi:protein TonB